MFRATLGFVICMYACTTFACGDRPIYSTTDENGSTVGLFLSDSDFANVPNWNPGEGEPPLSISSAVSHALSWATSRYSKYDSVKVSGISMAWYRCSARPAMWYYKIDLTPIIDGNDVRDSGAWVAVLFDGKTIGPREVN